MRHITFIILFLTLSISFSQDNITLIYLDDSYRENRSKIEDKIKELISESEKIIFLSTNRNDSIILSNKMKIRDELDNIVFSKPKPLSHKKQIEKINNYFNDNDNIFFKSLKNENDDILKNKINFHFLFDEDNFIGQYKNNNLIDKILLINRLMHFSENKSNYRDLESNCNVTLHVRNVEEDDFGDTYNKQDVKSYMEETKTNKIYNLKYY